MREQQQVIKLNMKFLSTFLSFAMCKFFRGAVLFRGFIQL